MSCKTDSHPSRYLIIAPNWLGDAVMSQTVLKRIKQLDPSAIIDVLAKPVIEQVYQLMPEVSDIHIAGWQAGKLQLGLRWRLAREFKHRYSHAIVLPNSWKSALLPALAGIQTRRGWLGECRYGVLTESQKLDAQKYPLMIQRFLRLAEVFSDVNADASVQQPLEQLQSWFPQFKVDAGNTEVLFKQFPILNTDQPQIIFCPGAAFGPAKQWPAHHWAKLADQYSAQGWQIVVAGGPGDVQIATDIAAQATANVVNLVAKTRVTDVAAMMSLAKVVVSNDSGLMHIAAAVGVPVVGVYGSTSPKFTPPLSLRSKMVALELECRPCFQRVCPLKHLACLNELQPELVHDAIKKVLA